MEGQLINVINDALRNKELSAAAASKLATGTKDAIALIFRGHDPRFSKVEKIAKALGLEFYIGPPRLRNLNKSQSYSEIGGVAEPSAAYTNDANLDKIRLTDAIETCETGLAIAGKLLPPEKKAMLVQIVYEMLGESEARSPEIETHVSRFIRLVA